MRCVVVMNSTDTKVNMRPEYDPSIRIGSVEKDTINSSDTVHIDTPKH